MRLEQLVATIAIGGAASTPLDAKNYRVRALAFPRTANGDRIQIEANATSDNLEENWIPVLSIPFASGRWLTLPDDIPAIQIRVVLFDTSTDPGGEGEGFPAEQQVERVIHAVGEQR